MHKPLSVCSGGERARAVLAGILLTKATVLILDEPTNHLDVATVESLLEALKHYGGTVLLASHDARFVEQLCTGIIQVGDGKISRWPGSTVDYCSDMATEIQAQFAGKNGDKPSKTPANEQSKGKSQPGYAQLRRELRKRISAAERQQERHRQRVNSLQDQLLGGGQPDELAAWQGELNEAQEALDAAEESWLVASGELEELEAGQ